MLRPTLMAIAVMFAAPAVSAGFDQTAGTVSAGNHRRHMEVLASDEFVGREAGTPGFDAAARYVAEQFESLGLQPMGADGGYFQHIDFLESRLLPESARFEVARDGRTLTLSFPDDFVMRGGFGDPHAAIQAPLVFVGHGIVAPEYVHDDYAGLDVQGKIVVILSGAPPGFDTDQRAFYSSATGKRETASQRGAVGLVTLLTPVDQQRIPWSRMVSGATSASLRWLEDDGQVFEGFPQLVGGAVLSESGARALFDLAGHSLDEAFARATRGEAGGTPLGVTALLSQRSQLRHGASANVIAGIRGSDPALRDEYLLYSAHLDHLGVRSGNGPEAVHNGAYDNAAGVAVVLELARVMAQMPTKPRRSILFVTYTAEEKGLQGSSYLAHHPPVPLSQLVANINVDMPFLGFPIGDVEGFGADHSSLLMALKTAAAINGLDYTPDPRPELVRFIRSDQFSLVKAGVPGMNLKPGSRSTDPAIDGEALRDDFLSNHYHRPSDDLSLPYSAQGAARFIKTALLLGLIVADADARPRWNDGDFFGQRFAPTDGGH